MTADNRTKALSEAALRCRSRRQHPTVDLVDALLGHPTVTKTVEFGVTTLRRNCLTAGCLVYALDVYSAVGEHTKHELKYPKDENGNDLYLMAPGEGRLHPADVTAEIFERFGGKARRRKS